MEAQANIPDAFSSWRHPEKLFFFFRKESLVLLKSDPTIWRLRQRLRLLLLLSLFVPTGGFLIIALVAFWQMSRP